MMPIVDGLEEEFGGEIAFLRLDAADNENAVLQEQYGLRGHPSFVVVDGSGVTIERYFGPQDQETLRTVLARVVEPVP